MDRLLLPDGLGDTRGILDGTGQQVSAAFRYDAYGLRTAVTGNNADPTANQYKGATGYEREPVGGIGLDYLQQRYYDASVGRFISRDPIRWAGGLNLYGYCEGDPVNHADPTGLSDESLLETVYKAPWRCLMALFGNVKMKPGTPTFQSANEFYAPHLRRAGREIYDFLDDEGAEITNNVLAAGLELGVASRLSSCQQGVITIRSPGGRDVRPMEMVRKIARFEKIDAIENELKALTFQDGVGHAVVSLPDGSRAIVRGGHDGITFRVGQVRRIIGHTHPPGKPAAPSVADQDALHQLGQRRSYLIRGERIRFGPWN